MTVDGFQEIQDAFVAHTRKYHGCKHPERVLRKRTLKGGAIAFVEQCQICGSALGHAIKRELALQQCKGQEPSPFDEALRLGWMEQADAEYSQLVGNFEDKKERLRAEFWKEYDAYLLTPAWQAKREKVLKRAKDICEGCAVRPASQVHHLTYKHFMHEFLFELAAVCQTCHDRLHEEHVKKLEDPRKF